MPMFWEARPSEARAVRSWASGISVGRSWNPAEDVVVVVVVEVVEADGLVAAESLMASEGGNNANAPLASLKACEYLERER